MSRGTGGTDVLIIGAGVIGSAIALELSRAGRDVTVLDKAGGIGHGSTSASSAIVRFHYSTLTGVATAWEAVHSWQDWENHLGFADPAGLARFERSGLVVLSPSADGVGGVTGLFDQVGVPWELWGPAEFAERLPQVDAHAYGPPKPVDSDAFFASSDRGLYGTFTPDAGYVDDAQLAAQNLGMAAQHFGATYLLRREVTTIERLGDGWRVRTAEGDVITAAVVVNAAGPWSSRVNAMAGIGDDFSVTSRPLRQEVHQVPWSGEGASEKPGVGIADPDLGIYIRSAGPAGIFVGGMEPECDELQWLDDPDQADPNPTGEVFHAQVLRAARRLPDLRMPNRPVGVAGVYDVSSDWAPIYDRTSESGFYVAMGTSGNQFKNAPVVGELMASLIAAVEAGHDHDAEPLQVPALRTGQVLDLGNYSRLRPVDALAPASVMG